MVINIRKIKAMIIIVILLLLLLIGSFVFFYLRNNHELYSNKNMTMNTQLESENQGDSTKNNEEADKRNDPNYREAYVFQDNPNYHGKYRIDVNRLSNTVTVYEKNDKGQYNIPIKAMVCSTGPATPLGDYYTPGRKQEVGALFGDVWGIYVTDIVGDILFHSVPADQPKSNRIIGAEYNKLGTPASMGCVRLSVPDAKWIVDNVDTGTWVHFYDDVNPGPLGKPIPLKMDKDFGIDPNYEK